MEPQRAEAISKHKKQGMLEMNSKFKVTSGKQYQQLDYILHGEHKIKPPTLGNLLEVCLKEETHRSKVHRVIKQSRRPINQQR